MKFISQQQRRAQRRRLARGAGASLALAAMVAMGGALLPTEHVTRGTAVFDRSPETVWRVLTDLDGMPLWRTDLATLERLPSHGGRTAWREVSRQGARVLERSQESPPYRLVVRGAAGGGITYPMRSFDLASTDRGTRVTITERSEISNPVRRVLARLNPGRTAVEQFLRDLDQRLRVNRRQVAVDGMP